MPFSGTVNKTEKESANILKRSRRLTMKFHLSGEPNDNRAVYLFLGGFVKLAYLIRRF